MHLKTWIGRMTGRLLGREAWKERPACMQRSRMFLPALLLLLSMACSLLAAEPKNVILFIGDGMGVEQVKAARCYQGSPLPFESFPHQALMTTHSANNPVTDSAASGTAMATGHKVNNEVVCQARPANDEYPEEGSDMQTMLEYFQAQGKATGLVTTTSITHATPACFAAHTSDRYRYSEITHDLLYRTRPNVLFGGGGNGMSEAEAKEEAGYTVVTNRAQMLALARRRRTPTRVSGQFGHDHMPYEYDGLGALPHLSEMTTSALGILDDDPDGFFLMVEGGRIDHAGHDNKIRHNVLETIEFGSAVQQAIQWANERSDTLILVTADHECGGLKVVADEGQGEFPEVTWSTGNHTAAKVPVYAWGPNAEMISGVIDNTDIFEVLTGALQAATAAGP